ncbi:unnamed protein product [Gongylonema pulchrum]|uniref:Uncharacterized protein n=1 Tax=Gongylonema pulchrum TaxID=637853 RepID=A0A183EZG3_9BILA|nr:unnamed protein product [Gongylonema pulchrum]
MRYVDGGAHHRYHLDVDRLDSAPSTARPVRRASIASVSLEDANRLEWVTPFICLFTC